MCIPQPQTSAAPANQVPSMQAADNLALGGSGEPRGAAALGRLQLRLMGNPGAAPVAATPGSVPNTPVAGQVGAPPVPPSAGSANPIPNYGLRFGQGAGNRP